MGLQVVPHLYEQLFFFGSNTSKLRWDFDIFQPCPIRVNGGWPKSQL